MSLPMANSQFILSQQIVSMSTPSLNDPDYHLTNGNDGRDNASPPRRQPRSSDTLLVPTITANGAAKLASNYPASQRAEAQRLFQELLSEYGRLMQQLGIQPNDMAGTVAAFIASSYAPYNHSNIADADFKSLVRQMRGTLAANPAFDSASPADRRDAFEQLAILGMMAATVQLALRENPEHPQAARIRTNQRKAGGEYLAGFLGVSADKVNVGPERLSISEN